ncbi:MAG: alkaline phosphatase PhoX, partial [Pseudomonadota bacterium]
MDCPAASFTVPGFGELAEAVPLNTDALGNVVGAGDLRGVPLLQLPPGFQYTAISIRGDVMSDGNIVPGDHDGMAAFRTPDNFVALVRNHELSIDEDEEGNQLGCLAANGRQYDPFQGEGAGLGGGGTSTVIVNTQGFVVEDFVSLGGTIRNCAGGPTPWGSWISCEENVSTPSTDTRATVKHGYNFEVPSRLREAVEPIPLIAMGRMNHEAISTDPRDGYVYETEDRGDSAWYRFVPDREGSR